MTFDETLYARRDDEMDDYGDGAYGDSLDDEEYEEEEEEEEEPETVCGSRGRRLKWTPSRTSRSQAGRRLLRRARSPPRSRQ